MVKDVGTINKKTQKNIRKQSGILISPLHGIGKAIKETSKKSGIKMNIEY